MPIGKYVRSSCFKTFVAAAIAASVACATGGVGAPPDVRVEVWTFLETVKDTVCASCATIYVHSLIGFGSSSPVGESRVPKTGFELTPAPVEGSAKQGPSLRAARFDDIPTNQGNVVLVAHFPPEPADSDRFGLLIVNIYVAKDGHWLLEGSAVARRVRTGKGSEYQVMSLHWT